MRASSNHFPIPTPPLPLIPYTKHIHTKFALTKIKAKLVSMYVITLDMRQLYCNTYFHCCVFSGMAPNTCIFPSTLKINQSKATSNGVFKELREVKNQNFLTDFVLKAHGGEISCHKIVLAVRSAYFQRLFSFDGSKEMAQGFIEFETLHYTALEAVIEYCYSGRLEFKPEDAQNVIEVAEYLQIPDLVSRISKQVERHLSADNCIGWYFLAKWFDISTLKEAAHKIMSAEFTSVTNNAEFSELDYNNLKDYISWKDVNEDSALAAVCRWMKHDIQHRQCMFHDIVNTIDIHCCSSSALKYVIQQHEELLTPDVKKKLTDTIVDKVSAWQKPDRGTGYDIIVLGGQKGKHMSRKSCKMNLKTGITVKKECFPSHLPDTFIPAICTVPSGALFVGGMLECDGNSLYSKSVLQCVVYKKQEDIWEILSMPPLSPLFYFEGSVCVDDKSVYVMGGTGDDRNKMYCFDLIEKTWHSCPDMLVGLVVPLVGCVGKSIYVIHSTMPANDAHLDPEAGLSMQCFDTNSSTWSSKASLPHDVERTHGARTATVDKYLYVIGGGARLCLCYDTQNDVWSTLAHTIQVHSFGAAVVIKGTIFLCGGFSDNQKELDTIERYDPSTDVWTVLSMRLPRPLMNHHVFAL